MRLPRKSSFQSAVALHLIAWLVVVVNTERSDDEILRIIADRSSRDPEALKLAGRFDFGNRKKLPSGDIFATGMPTEQLECGETYPMDRKGYLYFTLQPDSQPCQYSFLGSRKNGCTAAMLCKGRIALSPKSAQGCEQEYLKLEDGTEGAMFGCGNFTFGGKPRIARNDGKDLYVTIKGSSPKRCYVFCLEDLGKKRPEIKETKRIKGDEKYTGLKMESDCTCGKRNDVGRIVGGETAFKFEFPWLGSIVFGKKAAFSRKPICGGSLINDRYFLTAAHCFDKHGINPHEIRILFHHHVVDKRLSFGALENDPELKDVPGWDLPDETDESEESIRVEVEEIINHPLFNLRSFDYDVSLIKFKTPIPLQSNKKISPICFPEVKEMFNFEDGTNMVVAGWGYPSEKAKGAARILQKLDVPFANYEDCKKYTFPQPRHMCAGYIEGGKDSCSGDSGGPLIYKFDNDNNKYLVAGVVSAGAGCARKNVLGLYTDVQEIMQWVYQQMDKDAKWCARK